MLSVAKVGYKSVTLSMQSDQLPALWQLCWLIMRPVLSRCSITVIIFVFFEVTRCAWHLTSEMFSFVAFCEPGFKSRWSQYESLAAAWKASGQNCSHAAVKAVPWYLGRHDRALDKGVSDIKFGCQTFCCILPINTRTHFAVGVFALFIGHQEGHLACSSTKDFLSCQLPAMTTMLKNITKQRPRESSIQTLFNNRFYLFVLIN